MKETSDQIKAGSDGSFLSLLSTMFFPLFFFSTHSRTVLNGFLVFFGLFLAESDIVVFVSTFQMEIEASPFASSSLDVNSLLFPHYSLALGEVLDR